MKIVIGFMPLIGQIDPGWRYVSASSDQEPKMRLRIPNYPSALLIISPQVIDATPFLDSIAIS